MNFRRFLLPFVLVAVVACISFSPCFAQRNQVAPYETPAEQQAWNERNRIMVKLYLSRYERNVTQEVLPFALERTDRNADIRTRAIIMLGRIEDGKAEAPLQKLLDQLQEKQSKIRPQDDPITPVDAVPLFRLKLALGRIRARDLKGKEKLDAVAKSIDLTWEKVQEMGDQLKEATSATSTHHRLLMDSYQLEVVLEFFDVLRSMGRNGEDLDVLGASHLVYHPLLEPLLTSSRLTRGQEAEFWLKRSETPTTFIFNPAVVASLGNEVKPILLKHLQLELGKAKEHPDTYQGMNRLALMRMFDSASATADLQFVPVLEEFSKLNNERIANDAQNALRGLQDGSGTVILPHRPINGF